jgi:signal transduction histidine kinase
LSSQLAALKYHLESTAWSNLDSAEREKRIERTCAMIRDAIEETRRIMANLRPSILDDLGILPTITWFCREFQELHPAVLTSVNIDVREEEIPDSIKTVIFRLLHEALNFLQETRRAGTVRISLKRTNSSIHFQVSGDGWADVQEEALSRKKLEHGFGLRGMRERVELSGGKCDIESSPGKGVAIRAEWRIKP